DECAPEFLGQRLALVVLQVGEHDLDPVLGEQARRRLAQSGGAPGDNGRSPVQFHGRRSYAGACSASHFCSSGPRRRGDGSRISRSTPKSSNSLRSPCLGNGVTLI